MPLRLRPYHPTYLVGYFGIGSKTDGFNKDGFNDAIARILADPEIEVELVEDYDDVCLKCGRRTESAHGSVWGPQHTCPTAEDPEAVVNVNEANRWILRKLGLRIGSVVRFRDLVASLAREIPVLDDEMIGGPRFQARYEQGLAALARFWGQQW